MVSAMWKMAEKFLMMTLKTMRLILMRKVLTFCFQESAILRLKEAKFEMTWYFDTVSFKGKGPTTIVFRCRICCNMEGSIVMSKLNVKSKNNTMK